MDSGRIPERIKGYTLHRSELAHKAYYYLQRFGNHKIISVTDDDGTAIGILTPGDFSML
jgi:hypothetical protein